MPQVRRNLHPTYTLSSASQTIFSIYKVLFAPSKKMPDQDQNHVPTDKVFICQAVKQINKQKKRRNIIWYFSSPLIMPKPLPYNSCILYKLTKT